MTGFEQDLPDVETTIIWGRHLGARLQRGDIVVLTGDLGAGKTTLTRGIGEGLGVRGAVSSPTFVLAREHPSVSGGPALMHVDAYRLNGPQEIDDLDLPVEDCVTIVEWGENRVEHLAESRLHIALGPDGDGRRATIQGVGPRWTDATIADLAIDA